MLSWLHNFIVTSNRPERNFEFCDNAEERTRASGRQERAVFCLNDASIRNGIHSIPWRPEDGEPGTTFSSNIIRLSASEGGREQRGMRDSA